MRKTILLILVTCFGAVQGQGWTAAQLAKANTAKDVKQLSETEKEAILYINLARLYPKDFARNEVAGYDDHQDSPYTLSLIRTLNSMSPVGALSFNEDMYALAKCFAAEQGASGATGHKRKRCKTGYRAECCAYGMDSGKEIALEWLIDHNVTSLGHRKICLDAAYTQIGLSVHAHKEWSLCCVADLK